MMLLRWDENRFQESTMIESKIGNGGVRVRDCNIWRSCALSTITTCCKTGASLRERNQLNQCNNQQEEQHFPLVGEGIIIT